MPSTTAIRGILNSNLLRILRDRFLVGMSLYILFVFLVVRGVLPWVTNRIASSWGFDLTPYFPLIVSHFAAQLAPLIPGIIGGFLLLESREEGTVKALLVSPVPLSSYLSIACLVMVVVAVPLTVAAGALIGRALPPWPSLIAVGLAAAPAAPIFALLVAAIANNKVQAFVYLKLFGLGPAVPLGAYFLPEPGQWMAAVYPPYCASKAYWIAEAGGSTWPVWTVAGLVSSAAWVYVLFRVFLRAART